MAIVSQKKKKIKQWEALLLVERARQLGGVEVQSESRLLLVAFWAVFLHCFG